MTGDPREARLLHPDEWAMVCAALTSYARVIREQPDPPGGAPLVAAQLDVLAARLEHPASRP